LFRRAFRERGRGLSCVEKCSRSVTLGSTGTSTCTSVLSENRSDAD